MPKGYFVSAHRREADPEKRAAYLKLAGPALQKYEGKMLASTNKIKVFENGIAQQTVIIEFETYQRQMFCKRKLKWILVLVSKILRKI